MDYDDTGTGIRCNCCGLIPSGCGTGRITFWTDSTSLVGNVLYVREYIRPTLKNVHTAIS